MSVLKNAEVIDDSFQLMDEMRGEEDRGSRFTEFSDNAS